MLFEDLVAAVIEQGGFDTTAADLSSGTVGAVVNEVYREAVTEAQWMMAVETLATTVADQASYPWPDNVADIVAITIDAGDGPADWQPKALTDIWALKRGALRLVGSGGVFAQSASSDGAKQFELFPAPTQADLAIEALVALVPPALENGDSPVTPEDTHPRLIDAAIARLLSRTENRDDLAQVGVARKQELVALLQRRKNSRAGSTPTRIAIEGYDF